MLVLTPKTIDKLLPKRLRRKRKVMALTRNFRESVMEELRNKEYRRAFLGEAINDMLAGDLDSAKMVLREYINGTVGFIKVADALGRSPKSLMRMLSSSGNPQARNLLELVAYLQKTEGATAEVRFAERAA
jgi:DNA-binding phage protein